MPGLESIDINDIARQVMDPATYEESTRPRTVPTGTYRFYRREVVGQRNDRQQDFAHYTVRVTDKEGNERGLQFFDVSPNTYRDDSGRIAKMTRLFGQMAKALDLPAEDATFKQIDEAFADVPVAGFVSETFVSPDTPARYHRVEYTEDGAYNAAAKAKLDEGWTPRNYVQSISKVKA